MIKKKKQEHQKQATQQSTLVDLTESLKVRLCNYYQCNLFMKLKKVIVDFACSKKIGDIQTGKNKKEEYTSIRDNWKDIDWDLIQRMRFMNADAEIDPADGYELKKDDHDE